MYNTQPNQGVGPTAPSLRSSVHKYLAREGGNGACVHARLLNLCGVGGDGDGSPGEEGKGGRTTISNSRVSELTVRRTSTNSMP